MKNTFSWGQRAKGTFEAGWDRKPNGQISRLIGGNLQYQKIKVKCLGSILRVSELIIGREAASNHQERANPSQKPTSTSNTTVSQAVPIQQQTHPGSAGTSFSSSKQQPQGQESELHHCPLLPYRIIDLIKASNYPHGLYKLPESAPKRKRGQDAAHRSSPTHDQPPLRPS